jgi:hypothetical protein
VAYAAAARCGWPGALVAATLTFAAVAAALQRAAWALAPTAVCAVAALAAALVLMPRGQRPTPAAPPPAWDLPARMVLTTVLVLAITGAAPALGPRLSGVLATFPLYAAVLAVFAHRASAVAAVQVLRGLLVGLFAFAGFFLVLGAMLDRVGIAAAFGLAAATALAIQGASLALVVGVPESGRL